jgi:hypothetical protein
VRAKKPTYNNTNIGADTGGMGGSIPTFIPVNENLSPHFNNVQSFLTLNTFSPRRRYLLIIAYLLSRFHVDVIVFFQVNLVYFYNIRHFGSSPMWYDYEF